MWIPPWRPNISICATVDFTNCWKKKKGIISPANTLDFLLEGLIVVVSQWFSWMERKMEKAVCWKDQAPSFLQVPVPVHFSVHVCAPTFPLWGSEFLPILQDAALLKSLLPPKALQSSCTWSYWHAKSLFLLRSHCRNMHNLTFRILSLDHLFHTRDIKGF